MFSDPLTTQAALDFQSAAQRMAPKPPKKEKPEEIVEVKDVQDSRHGVCTGRKRCECGLNLVSVHPGRFRALLDQ